MQLYQLFQTRAFAQLYDNHSDAADSFPQRHLIPPQITQRLLGKVESPSNN